MKWINVKIDGYDTQYIISENGIVINLNTGREIKKTLVDGYMRSKFITGFGTNTIYRIKKNYCGTRPKNTLKSKHRIDAMILKMYFEGTSIDNIS